MAYWNRRAPKRFRKTWRKAYDKAQAHASRLVVSAAKGAASIVARKYLNTEIKALNSELAITILPSAGANWTIQRLNNISQGDGNSNRHGASVRLKSLQMTGRIRRQDNNVSAVPERVRCFIFVDKEPGVAGIGTSPAMTDVYTQNSPSTLRNWESILQKRFTVLWDRTYVLDQDNPERLLKLYKRMNMVSKWITSNTAGTACSDNALYFAVCSDSGGTSTTRPTIYYESRLTFIDN